MAGALTRWSTLFQVLSGFSWVWEGLLFIPLAIAFCGDKCSLGLCFEQNEEPCISEELEETISIFEENCNSKEVFSGASQWNKVFQISFAVIACTCIFKLKNDCTKSNSMMEVNNLTAGKFHFEVKSQLDSRWPANFYKLHVPKISPFQVAEFMAVSVLARRNTVAVCCHVLLTSTAKGFPLGRSYVKRNNKRAEVRVPLQGSPSLGYCAMLSIGVQHAQKICVLVDTGSYNLAVAAAPQQYLDHYFDTSRVDDNFEKLGKSVSVKYSVGQWSGVLVKDKISIQDYSNQSTEPVEVEFALIQHSKDFFVSGATWGGILGMAYSSIGQPDSHVRSLWDALKEKHSMKDVFGLKLCPTLGSSEQGGELMLGGQFGLVSNSIHYTSIVKEEYYNVLISSISVGNHSVDINCKEFNKERTIVDSGTTDIQLAETAFIAVVEILLQYFQDSLHIYVPSDFWIGLSKLAWSSEDLQFVYSEFPTIYIGFADDKDSSLEFSLAITSQIYLQEVQGTLEERQSSYCHPKCSFFLFGIKPRSDGSVIGSTAMSGFTTIFDRKNRRLGFALSTCKYPDYGKELLPHIIGPYSRKAENCAWSSSGWTWWISITCIFITICCLIILILLKCRMPIKKYCCITTQAKCCCSKYKQLHNATEVGNSSVADEERHEVSSTTQPFLARIVTTTPIILVKKYWKKIMYKENVLSTPQQATEESECVSLIADDHDHHHHHGVSCVQPVEEESSSWTDSIMIVTTDGRSIVSESGISEDTDSSEHNETCVGRHVGETTAEIQQSSRKTVPASYQLTLDRQLPANHSFNKESFFLAGNQKNFTADEVLQHEYVINSSKYGDFLPSHQSVSDSRATQLQSPLATSSGSSVPHPVDLEWKSQKIDFGDTIWSGVDSAVEMKESENIVETLSVSSATSSETSTATSEISANSSETSAKGCYIIAENSAKVLSCIKSEVYTVEMESSENTVDIDSSERYISGITPVLECPEQVQAKEDSEAVTSSKQNPECPCVMSHVNDIEVTSLNVDSPGHKLAPAKLSIMDGYPKLALSETATILEESNNNPNTSDETQPVAATILEESYNNPNTSDETQPEAATIVEESNNSGETLSLTSSDSTSANNNDSPDSSFDIPESSEVQLTEIIKEIPRNKNTVQNMPTKKSQKSKKGTRSQNNNCNDFFIINQQNNDNN